MAVHIHFGVVVNEELLFSQRILKFTSIFCALDCTAPLHVSKRRFAL